jgi:hypothetical protein
VNFVENSDDETSLYTFVRQIKSLDSIFKELEGGSNINWDALESI